MTIISLFTPGLGIHLFMRNLVLQHTLAGQSAGESDIISLILSYVVCRLSVRLKS